MRRSEPTWQLVLQAARDLVVGGQATFELKELIAAVQQVDSERGRGSISPVVQGMTVNAGKGPPSPCGKVLVRVDHGRYRLATPDDGSASEATAHGGTPTRPRSLAGRARTRSTLVDQRVRGVMEQFEQCVDAYDDRVPFTRSGQYRLHRRTIDRRRAVGSVADAVADDEFTELLHTTLQAWGVGRRGSRLVDLDQFRTRLRDSLPATADLEHPAIDDTSLDVAATGIAIDELVRQLGVVENRSLVVAGTKALHHLLPDLVPPMDRAWTGAFFGWTTADPQANQSRILREAFGAFAEIARVVRPSGFVGDGWRTSTTKVLDNAIIGYCLVHEMGPGAAGRDREPGPGHEPDVDGLVPDPPVASTGPARAATRRSGLVGALRRILRR